MRTEQALREFPGPRQDSLLLQRNVNPVDSVRVVLILDTVTVSLIVFHYLSAAAAPLLIYLEEDDITGSRNPKLEQVFQTLYD